MLRRRPNLPPRVSNNLAALSAVLLLISFLVGKSDSMFISGQSLNLPVSAQQESMEPGQDELPAVETTAREVFKISLMIFR